jgi:nickel/cobalt exporter
MLNKNIPFGYLILAMSSGIFLTLSIFSFIIKNITFSFKLKKNKNYIKYSNLSLNLIILLLGIYMLFK